MNQQDPRWQAIKQRAVAAGCMAVDDGRYAFIVKFFDTIVEECAQAAESRLYEFSGDGSEAQGVTGAASAVRYYGKTVNQVKK